MKTIAPLSIIFVLMFVCTFAVNATVAGPAPVPANDTRVVAELAKFNTLRPVQLAANLAEITSLLCDKYGLMDYINNPATSLNDRRNYIGQVKFIEYQIRNLLLGRRIWD